jgi:putative ferrous iron transport protein C
MVNRQGPPPSNLAQGRIMILSELRSYLKQNHRVALKDIELHFKTDADALRGMLGLWITKGYVKKLPTGTACSTGCCKCDPALIEIYEWVER